MSDLPPPRWAPWCRPAVADERAGDLSVQPQIANGAVAAVSKGVAVGSGTYSLEVTALATSQVIKSPALAAATTVVGAVASPTDPGTLAGSLRRLSEQKTRLAAEKTDLAAAQERLRSQIITRFAGTESRVGASRATLSFLRNQIDAWNARSN